MIPIPRPVSAKKLANGLIFHVHKDIGIPKSIKFRYGTETEYGERERESKLHSISSVIVECRLPTPKNEAELHALRSFVRSQAYDTSKQTLTLPNHIRG